MSSRLRFAWYDAIGRGSIDTSRPDSSRASRRAATRGDSPGSTRPESASHAPAPASLSGARRMASTRPARNTAITTATMKRSDGLMMRTGRRWLRLPAGAVRVKILRQAADDRKLLPG